MPLSSRHSVPSLNGERAMIPLENHNLEIPEFQGRDFREESMPSRHSVSSLNGERRGAYAPLLSPLV
jgi:hypothetical protein